MKNIRKIIKLTAIIGGGAVIIGGIALGMSGYWPIALAGPTPISYNAFRDNFYMVEHFYRSNIKIAGEDDRVVDAKDVQRDLQRATMEGMLERLAIDRELERRYASSDLDRLVQNKVGGITLDSEDMKKGTELLYGLTPERFKELVLIPKARQEILEGNFTLQNISFSDWMMEQKKAMRVSVFIPGMRWENGEVKIK